MLDTLVCALTPHVDFIVLFDKAGQVYKIERYKDHQPDGFIYYFSKNRLDSIRRFKDGQITQEFFLFSKEGQLSKYVLPDGYDIDSAFTFKCRAFPSVTYSLAQGRNSQVFEMDNKAVLKRIYDVDEKSSTPYKPIQYDIYIPNGYNIYMIINQETGESIMFSRGELVGIYTYHDGELDGFRLLFNNYPHSRVKELSFWEQGKMQPEVLKFRKNGREY